MPAVETSPERITVKVNAVLPELPSALLASVAAMAMVVESSFRMVPVAVAVVMVAPLEGADNVTVKPSSGSTRLSAATLTVITALAAPAAKFTTPDGSTPPVKSAPFAGLAPEPATA